MFFGKLLWGCNLHLPSPAEKHLSPVGVAIGFLLTCLTQCPCCPFTDFGHWASSRRNHGISRLLPLRNDAQPAPGSFHWFRNFLHSFLDLCLNTILSWMSTQSSLDFRASGFSCSNAVCTVNYGTLFTAVCACNLCPITHRWPLIKFWTHFNDDQIKATAKITGSVTAKGLIYLGKLGTGY